MRITLDTLRRFTDLPQDVREARRLLDEVGLEVKRIDPEGAGVPVTLELLANRGDHHAYVGLAREISARTGAAVRAPGGLPLAVGPSPHPIRVASELCSVYSLTRLVRRRAGTLSAEARALLAASGLREVHPVVDATNVANLELGQPTHAFDAARVEGPVVVRRSVAGESAWLLFQPGPIPLPEGLLVIADAVKVLAIAGVIGCEDSKTTEATEVVLLESAAFDPVAVRKGARALGVHTDSSARFERGSDFGLPVAGAGRVAALLAEAGWEVEGPTGVVSSWTDPRRVVRFEPAACRRFLDIPASDAELLERLGRQGFEPEGAGVRVPSWRLWDVHHPADLYEEIAKSIGYDATPVGLPPVDMGSLPGPVERAITRASEVLVAAGFYEVVTDGFHARALDEQLGIGADHPLAAHVETENALDRAYSLLKNNALAQALDGVAANLRMKHDEIKAFEWTRTFHPDATAANGVCTERRLLWAIASGPERARSWAGEGRTMDALTLKGLVGELAAALRLPLEVGPADPSYPLGSALHPNRQAAIRRGGVTVGVLGEVHPGVVTAFRIRRARPVYLEIALDALVGEPDPFVFSEPPRVPPVPRSLAFTLPARVEAGAVAAVLRAAGGEALVQVAIVDLFEHEEEGQPVRTFTFELLWDNEEADAKGEQVNAATLALVEAVTGAFGGAVRLRA